MITAPEEVQHQLKGLTTYRLVIACSRLRGDRSSDPVVANAKVALSSLAHRIQSLEHEIADLKARILVLVERTAPELLGRFGVGPDTAAALLVAAGDNPERLHSEAAFAHLCGVSPIPASSGKTTGHFRLDSGGDRQANSALWRIVIVRIAHDPRITAYYQRRVKEGVLEARCDPHLEALRRPRALSLLASQLKIAVVGLTHSLTVVPRD